MSEYERRTAEKEGPVALRDVRTQIYGLLYYLYEYLSPSIEAGSRERLDALGLAASRVDSSKGLSALALSERLRQNLQDLTNFAISVGIKPEDLTRDKLIAFEGAQVEEDVAYLKAFKADLETLPNMDSDEDEGLQPKIPIN